VQDHVLDRRYPSDGIQPYYDEDDRGLCHQSTQLSGVLVWFLKIQLSFEVIDNFEY
jgi:hypothetical protein